MTISPAHPDLSTLPDRSTAPDLSTAQGRIAYRRTLRGIARKRRALGLVALTLGAGLVIWPRFGGPWMFGAMRTELLGLALIAIGFGLMAWVMAKWLGHHRHHVKAAKRGA